LNTSKETRKPILSNWKYLLAIVGVCVIVLFIVWRFFSGGVGDLPSAVVQKGEFIIDLRETGRLRAENSETVSAPPVRITLQIVTLVEEGNVVQKGDVLVAFDSTEIRQRIDDLEAELSITRANQKRDLASMDSQMAGLRSSVKNSEASYRLSELRLEQMEFEADVRIEEGKLNLLQAKLSLDQSRDQVNAQEQINAADLESLEMRIHQAELDLKKAYREMRKLVVTAPAPGLVVYKEMWRGGEMAKVKIGDTPWRGMALIELPDLSVMMIETSVSEVDVAKIKLDLPVIVKLDAYPEPEFHGIIVDIANMASTDPGQNDAKVFDILIRLEESGPLLKPGMSATARIIIDRIPDTQWVPIESIFSNDGNTVVYAKNGRNWEKNLVDLGPRNDNFVIVEAGIAAGERVALVDPTKQIEFKKKEEVTEKNQLAPAKSNNKTRSKGRRTSRKGR